MRHGRGFRATGSHAGDSLGGVGAQGAGPLFLVVDDEPLMQRALGAFLHHYGTCRTALSADEAEQALATGTRWDGFVIDVRLGDGSGLDVLAAARRTHAKTPAVVLTASIERELVNRAAELDARYVCKPFGRSELAPFLSDVLRRASDDRLYAAAEFARNRWSLSPRQVEIVDATLRRCTRDEYVESTGMSLNTYKTHVRKLLDKTDYESLQSLALDLLRLA